MSRPVRPVTAEDLVELNKYLVENFGGGVPGVRYENGLHSAPERPFTALFGQEQFPRPENKAAAIMEGIIRSHCFHDGNKRTSLAAGLGLYEELTGVEIVVSKEEAVRICKDIEARRWGIEELSDWFARKAQES